MRSQLEAIRVAPHINSLYLNSWVAHGHSLSDDVSPPIILVDILDSTFHTFFEKKIIWCNLSSVNLINQTAHYRFHPVSTLLLPVNIPGCGVADAFDYTISDKLSWSATFGLNLVSWTLFKGNALALMADRLVWRTKATRFTFAVPSRTLQLIATNFTTVTGGPNLFTITCSS